MFILGLAIGLIIGSTLGIVIIACLQVAGKADADAARSQGISADDTYGR